MEVDFDRVASVDIDPEQKKGETVFRYNMKDGNMRYVESHVPHNNPSKAYNVEYYGPEFVDRKRMKERGEIQRKAEEQRAAKKWASQLSWSYVERMTRSQRRLIVYKLKSPEYERFEVEGDPNKVVYISKAGNVILQDKTKRKWSAMNKMDLMRMNLCYTKPIEFNKYFTGEPIPDKEVEMELRDKEAIDIFNRATALNVAVEGFGL